MSNYWIIAVPTENKEIQTTRKRLDEATSGRGLSSNYKFRIPKLKVGTIDTLIALSDDLAKLDNTLSLLTKKVKRTFDDTRKNEPSKLRPEDRQLLADHHGDVAIDDMNSSTVPQALLIGDSLGNDPHSDQQAKTPKEAFQKFKWNRYVYNESDSIEKLRVKIVEDFAKTEDELRRLLSEYNEVKGFVTAQERKENGSLLVRPISKFVRPQDIIESEHLISLVLAVPRVKEAEFLANYQTAERHHAEKAAAEKKRLAEQEARDNERRDAQEKSLGVAVVKTTDDEEVEGAAKSPVAAAKVSKAHGIVTPTVVPNSALKIVGDQVPDDEFVLYRVVLFKRQDSGEVKVSEDGEKLYANVEKFKTICRDNRWTVRPFKYDAHEEERNKLHMAELLNKRRSRWEHLILWCESQFEEIFIAWNHVIAMRTYVEAILRYGLSTEWIAVMIQPLKNNEKKLRETLKNLYNKLGNQSLLGNFEGSEVDISSLGGATEYYPYVYVPVDFTDL